MFFIDALLELQLGEELQQLYEISFPLFGHIAEQDYLFLNNKLGKN